MMCPKRGGYVSSFVVLSSRSSCIQFEPPSFVISVVLSVFIVAVVVRCECGYLRAVIFCVVFNLFD